MMDYGTGLAIAAGLFGVAVIWLLWQLVKTEPPTSSASEDQATGASAPSLPDGAPQAAPSEIDGQQSLIAPPNATTMANAERWLFAGWVMVFFGGLAVAFGLFRGATVSVPSLNEYGLGGTSDVVNFSLLFDKAVLIGSGSSLLGTAVFCFAVGSILQAIAHINLHR